MDEGIHLYSSFSNILVMALCKNIVNQYNLVQKSLSLCRRVHTHTRTHTDLKQRLRKQYLTFLTGMYSDIVYP